MQSDSSDRRVDHKASVSSFKQVLPHKLMPSMARRTASRRGAAIILALAVSSHALRTPLRLSRPFASRINDVRRRSAAVVIDDDGALVDVSKDLKPLEIPTDGLVLADVEPLIKPKEAFIDRHPLLAKSLSMGITYGLSLIHI